MAPKTNQSFNAGTKEKKVMIFIVEGPSEEAALGTVMSEYFGGNEVRFTVVHGDITIRDYVSADSILAKINRQIELVKKKYRYRTGDFSQIIHLTDTDGVFIDNDDIVPVKAAGIKYFPDRMETNRATATADRNAKKAAVLYKLRKTGRIAGIPYRIYYNSCNLEHVLFHELKEFNDEEKERMADDFAERYEGKTGRFVDFISAHDVAVTGPYQKTWDFIEQGQNSLNRYTNFHLLFTPKGTDKI